MWLATCCSSFVQAIKMWGFGLRSLSFGLWSLVFVLCTWYLSHRQSTKHKDQRPKTKDQTPKTKDQRPKPKPKKAPPTFRSSYCEIQIIFTCSLLNSNRPDIGCLCSGRRDAGG